MNHRPISCHTLPHLLPAPATEVSEPLPLFAYGSLGDRELASRLLEHTIHATQAHLPDHEEIRTPGGDGPTLIAARGSEGIRGALYRGLSEEDFRRLDYYTGVHEGLYQRVRVEVEAEDVDDPEPAYLYLMTPKAAQRLARGRSPPRRPPP